MEEKKPETKFERRLAEVAELAAEICGPEIFIVVEGKDPKTGKETTIVPPVK